LNAVIIAVLSADSSRGDHNEGSESVDGAEGFCVMGGGEESAGFGESLLIMQECISVQECMSLVGEVQSEKGILNGERERNRVEVEVIRRIRRYEER